jgi:transposase
VFAKGNVAAHLVYETETEMKGPNDRVLSLDLGIKNFATTYDTFGNTRIYKGARSWPSPTISISVSPRSRADYLD